MSMKTSSAVKTLLGFLLSVQESTFNLHTHSVGLWLLFFSHSLLNTVRISGLWEIKCKAALTWNFTKQEPTVWTSHANLKRQNTHTTGLLRRKQKKNQLYNGTVPPERNSEISCGVLEKRISIAEKKYLPHHKNSLIMMTRSLEGFRLTIISMTVNLEGDGHLLCYTPRRCAWGRLNVFCNSLWQTFAQNHEGRKTFCKKREFQDIFK